MNKSNHGCGAPALTCCDEYQNLPDTRLSSVKHFGRGLCPAVDENVLLMMFDDGWILYMRLNIYSNIVDTLLRI